VAQLTCPTCATPFVPANVNLALGVASCLSCNEVHDLSQRAPRARDRTPADPTGFDVVEGAAPVVSWAWRGWVLVFLVLWCAIWDTAMLGVVGAALANGEIETLVFCTFHMLAGVGVTYFTLAMAVNRTTLALDGETLTVTHGPLPWFGDRAVARSDVRQVYVMEDRGSKGSRTYSVHVRVDPGHPVQLVRGLSTAERARFLEEWIERRLDLVDAPVSGEHS
jgi:hypothetical protein